MDERTPRMLRVEVAYALPDRQALIALEVTRGTTLAGAIEQSGIRSLYPEIGAGGMVVGVFGRRKPLETPVEEGDRVEIYRPLIADPKETRRRRAGKRSRRVR